MTFSQQTKQEILKNIRASKSFFQKSFAYAIIGAGATFSLTKEGLCPRVSSTDVNLLQTLADLVKKQYGWETQIIQEQKNKKYKYVATFPQEATEVFALLNDQVKFSKEFVFHPDSRSGFVKGLFAGFGSVSIPKHTLDLNSSDKSQSYHLEISLNNDEWKNDVEKIMLEIDEKFKVIQRKDSTVFYLKDADSIGDFLVYLGATRSKLELENVLIERSLRNTANRQTNCISANIDKALIAANKQLEAIARLRKLEKFDLLSADLQKVALLREEYPEETLSGLAEIANLTKNCISKRMNKIISLANKG